MEESKGGVDIVVYSADVREPFMGNSVPISVHIYRQGGKIVHVELENPEGMKMQAKVTDHYALPARTFRKLFTDVSP